MDLQAAGVYRRTQAERNDQRVSWTRPDRAFFAAGACHILAWTCRAFFAGEPIGIGAVRFADGEQAFHTFATWHGWAFDHCGWHAANDLIRVNEEFEARPLVRVEVTIGLTEFCQDHHHRMPDQYHDDPRPRARNYVSRFRPPWMQA
ncbi:hypothetical protein CGZ95_13960 [Enemella evansiae]|uniref:hypothetical protein n=1 Tax=Enemella evansiae TaxID=2016499 RepID=UPI000B95FCF0|nr:hypothetical protein [Enemella evansiae]OYN98281.1 hypothetical protein CGZ95_13960 [Enemella evansiae]